MKPYVIGVCGASCSGKTLAVEQILVSLKTQNAVVISQDSYYFSGSKDDNYDIPKAIDFARLIYDLKKLISNQEVEIPVYDFSTHSRLSETKKVKPSRVIIVEGILIFTQKELRDLLDLKVFISSYNELAFSRRLKRDVENRGRRIDEVTERYFKDVLPSSKIYIEPTECYADIVLKNNIEGKFIGLKILIDHISTVLSSNNIETEINCVCSFKKMNLLCSFCKTYFDVKIRNAEPSCQVFDHTALEKEVICPFCQK